MDEKRDFIIEIKFKDVTSSTPPKYIRSLTHTYKNIHSTDLLDLSNEIKNYMLNKYYDKKGA